MADYKEEWMSTTASYYTSQGGRDINEDYVLTRNTGKTYIAIVCDGLGGHEHGEVASRIAANCIADELCKTDMSPSALEEAIKKANAEVFKAGKGRTTASVIWLSGEDAIVANVGDTRIYQFRGNKVVYQNKDHSVAYFSYMNGDIKYEDIRFSKERNRLTRALGADLEVKVDVSTISVSEKDGFLVCSDGFWEYIEDDLMIGAFTNSNTSKEWLSEMKKIADGNSKENRDNNSAIVILNKT